jgi:arylsulfatase A-like enzyme
MVSPPVKLAIPLLFNLYNTIVIFASDNGPEFIKPWDGWAGPWRGQYFTAWEGGTALARQRADRAS